MRGWHSGSMRTLGIVAAALVASVGALSGCGGEDDHVAEDPNQSGKTMTVEEAAAVPCPAKPPRMEELSGPGTLPPRPLAIRLCRGPEPGTPLEDLPEQPLLTGTDRVVKAINGLAEAPAQEPCTMEIGPSYTLRFTYADGSTVDAVGETFGCRHIRVGDTTRTRGGRDVLKLVRQLLEDQGPGPRH